jgi:hypothetical protein
MPRYNDEQLDAEVLFAIKQHVGRQHPIGRWELVAKIFGPVAAGDQNDNNPADRQIRESVERLRKRGVLICDMGDGVGRYMAETYDEYKAFRAKYGSRAFAIIDTLHEMDEAAKREFPDILQPRLL